MPVQCGHHDHYVMLACMIMSPLAPSALLNAAKAARERRPGARGPGRGQAPRFGGAGPREGGFALASLSTLASPSGGCRRQALAKFEAGREKE
jgi:hypothetical protein